MPEKVFENKNHPMPFTRIEVVVFTQIDGGLHVLLAKRAQAPYAGKWALPGGVLRIDQDVSLDSAARRVMQERLKIDAPSLEQLCSVGGAKRDPRSPWALSIVYKTLVNIESVNPTAGKRIEALEWRKIESTLVAPLAFDHADLIRLAVNTTRSRVADMELPQGLLPDSFTLGELQSACELVLGHPLDKSSFRRKLADRDLVEPLVGAMRGGANRPAQLYRMRVSGQDHPA